MRPSPRLPEVLSCGLFAALLTTLVGAGSAGAYCLPQIQGYDGYSSWQAEVTYHLSDTLTDQATIAAIDAAFATWAAVKCSSLSFNKGAAFKIADVPFQNHQQDGIYVFWFTDADKAAWPTDPKYVSYSFFGIDGQGGISQASIGVNGFNTNTPWATDGNASAIDVQGQMTALIGQVIGLDKSDVADSVMTGTVSVGDTSKQTLEQDDIDAVTHLYLEQGCPQPPAPGASCTGSLPQPDGGTTPPVDGGTAPPSDGGTTPPPPPADGGTAPPPPQLDGGTAPPTPGTCTSSPQCAEGEVCTAEGVCVGKGGGDEGDGCCAVAPRRPRPLTVVLTLGLALWLGLRLRRRRR